MAQYSKMKNLLQYCQRKMQAVGKQWDKSWLSSFSSVFCVIVKAFLNCYMRKSFSEAGRCEKRAHSTTSHELSSQLCIRFGTWEKKKNPSIPLVFKKAVKQDKKFHATYTELKCKNFTYSIFQFKVNGY